MLNRMPWGLQEPRELLAGDLAPFVSIENGRGATPNDRFLRKLPRQGDSIKGELPAVRRVFQKDGLYRGSRPQAKSFGDSRSWR
jgi:hypothetical protein